MSCLDPFWPNVLIGASLGATAVNTLYMIRDSLKDRPAEDEKPDTCPHGESLHIACDQCDLGGDPK